MDPLEQIFMQGQIGSSGNGPSPQYQAFEDGQKTSLSRQKLALEERQVKAQEGLLPLRLLELKQNSELNSLKLQTAWQAKQDMIGNMKGAAELFSLTSQLQNNTPEHPVNIDMLRGKASEIISRYPTLAGTKMVDDAFGLFDKSEKFSEKARMAKEAAAAKITSQKEAEASRLETPDTKNAAALLKAEQSLPGALPVDDPSWAKRNLELLSEQTAKNGETIVTNPDGSVTITRGGNKNPIQGIQNKAVEKQVDALNTLNAGNQLLQLINPKTVGTQGMVGHVLFDVAGPQLADLTGNPAFAELANRDRVTYGTAARVFQSQVIRTLRSDSNIGEKERRDLLSAVPTLGAGESTFTAKRKIQTMLKLTADAQRIGAERLNIPIPQQFWKPTEIQAAVKTGKITKDQGLELLKNSPYLDRDAATVKELE